MRDPVVHRLDVRKLDRGGKDYEAALEPDFCATLLADAEALVPAGGRVTVRYSKSGNDVVVKGRVTGRMVVPCARCLEPAAVDVDAELSLLLVPETSPKARAARGQDRTTEGEETVSTEAELDTYDGDSVELDRFLREAFLLEVPPFPLCREDCPGISPPPVPGPDDPGGPKAGTRRPFEALLAARSVSSPKTQKTRKDLHAVAVPKRRTTRAKSKMRRAQHDKVTPVNLVPCSNCGEPTMPHRVCGACGFYKGAKVK